MHYRNGREAKNGDRVVQLDYYGKITAVGVLYDAVEGNDQITRISVGLLRFCND